MAIFKKKTVTKDLNLSCRNILAASPHGMAVLDNKTRIVEVNTKFAQLCGYSVEKLKRKKFKDIFNSQSIALLNAEECKLLVDFDKNMQIIHPNSSLIDVHCYHSLYNEPDSNIELSLLTIRDITAEIKQKKAAEELNWLKEKEGENIEKYQYFPSYGDVTELNTDRLILDNVGSEVLHAACIDIMELLETSVAVYERNGDYAFGMLVSGWCQVMDYASRKLCGNVDNATALSRGKWLCHEDCWNNSAKAAMEQGKPTDIKCIGGVHLYCEPIFAQGKVIGAINIGYGNPPQDNVTLQKLADDFKIDIQILQDKAKSYNSRPALIIENAKKRLHTTAMLIGNIVEQKLSSLELERSQESFHLLADVTFEGIVLHQDGVVVDVNESFCQLTGFEYEECIGKNLLSYIYESESIEKVKNNIIKNYAEPYKIMAKRKDGSVFIAELEARNIMHKGKEIRIVALRDITKRHQAETKLKESRQKFQALINQAPEYLFLHTTDGFIKEINQRTIARYGYTREELLTMHIKDIDPDFTSRDDDKNIWPQIEKDKPIIIQGKHKTKSGEMFPIELSLGLLEINDTKYYMALARDITQQVEAQKTISANQERFKLLVENIPDPVLLQEGDTGKIIDANRSALQIYGYTLDEIIGLYPQEIDISDQAKFIPERLKTLQEKGNMSFRTTHRKKDGSSFPVDYHGKYFLFKGKPILISICRDVSEQVKTAQELRESEERFRFIAESSIDCIWQMDRKLKFSYLSPSLFAMSGYQPQEWVGTPLWEHMPQEEFFRIGKLAMNMIKNYLTQNYVTFETRMYNKAGEALPLEINARPLIIDGKLKGLQGSTRLITDRVKHRQELDKYRQNLEKLVKERTAELEEKNKKLMKYNNLFNGREFRIKELRDDIKALKKELSKYTGVE